MSENLLFSTELTRIDLAQLLNCRVDYSPKIIRAFYSNIRIENKSIISEVKGTPILIYEERVSQILGLSSPDGPMFFEIHQSLTTVQRYLKAQAYMTDMGCDELADNYPVKINKLNLERRLLHYVVTHYLLNKSGNFAYANESE